MNSPAPLLAALRTSRHLAVLTGAGISAESGVPTFRDALAGLWARYDPMALATRAAFQRDPKLVWEWYAWRRRLVSQVTPNPGHYALADLAQRVPRLTLVTQNVDGLHQAAGSPEVIELHGNLGRVKCFDEDRIINGWTETGEVPPRCPDCGGWLRPDVVWFGEALPRAALAAAFAAAEGCDLFFSIGTSAVVEPAASLPRMAAERGALLVEVNPETTPLSDAASWSLCGPAGLVLPALLAAAWP
ncbi:MAG: NAD-dependent deacylase [Anaerolineales bacterium]|nr:NAD-dependent deacylase [Anaerolineales bacterium]